VHWQATPSTETSKGVGYTSADTDDVDQFCPNGSCSTSGFTEKQAGECMTPAT